MHTDRVGGATHDPALESVQGPAVQPDGLCARPSRAWPLRHGPGPGHPGRRVAKRRSGHREAHCPRAGKQREPLLVHADLGRHAARVCRAIEFQHRRVQVVRIHRSGAPQPRARSGQRLAACPVHRHRRGEDGRRRNQPPRRLLACGYLRAKGSNTRDDPARTSDCLHPGVQRARRPRGRSNPATTAARGDPASLRHRLPACPERRSGHGCRRFERPARAEPVRPSCPESGPERRAVGPERRGRRVCRSGHIPLEDASGTPTRTTLRVHALPQRGTALAGQHALVDRSTTATSARYASSATGSSWARAARRAATR